jgi:hypothetical protein
VARRTNHYEAAFEAWLRCSQTPYVAVDETRRSFLGPAAARGLSSGDDDSASAAHVGALKSVDFIVSPGGACSWLVDVKGRRFPSGKSRYWMNWTTREELESLARWEELFGPRFTAVFIFAYHVLGDRSPLPPDQLFRFRKELYAFVGIRLDHYLCWRQPLNAKWDTVTVKTSKFRQLARPAAEIFGIAARSPGAAQRAQGA